MVDEAPIFLIRLRNSGPGLLGATFHLLQADGLVTEVECKESSKPQDLFEAKHRVSSEIAGRLANGTRGFIADLAGLKFVTGPILGVLVSWLAQVKLAEANLVLANPSRRVRIALGFTFGDKIFSVFDSVEAAQSSLMRHHQAVVSKSTG